MSRPPHKPDPSEDKADGQLDRTAVNAETPLEERPFSPSGLPGQKRRATCPVTRHAVYLFAVGLIGFDVHAPVRAPAHVEVQGLAQVTELEVIGAVDLIDLSGNFLAVYINSVVAGVGGLAAAGGGSCQVAGLLVISLSGGGGDGVLCAVVAHGELLFRAVQQSGHVADFEIVAVVNFVHRGVGGCAVDLQFVIGDRKSVV